MSGNPFRASLFHEGNAAAPVPPNSFINADGSRAEAPERDDSVHNEAAPLPARTKKSVRIESPTSSPPHPASHNADNTLLQRASQGQDALSPPPFSPTRFEDNFEDIVANEPYTKDSTGADDAGPRSMAGPSWRSPGAPEPLRSPTGAPVNPFSRTLATIESKEKGNGEQTGHNRGNVRQSLDVEGFKKLLMMGITSPSSSGPPVQSATAHNPVGASIFESSSSTDTSSVSRQSIFEPVQELHVETPRTSYEMAPSEDDERIGLVTEAKKDKKVPPPAPRHRHGKLVASRAPQTVSFSDFSATQSATSPPASLSRTNSDLNKPLPQTPPIQPPPASLAVGTPDLTALLDAKTSESSSLSDAYPPQKKMPPPVPLARRQSQLRTSSQGNRSRSNSSLTISSQHSVEFPIISPVLLSESGSIHKAAPPPPPSRRHGASITGSNNSSANSSTTELPSAVSPRRPAVTSPTTPSSRRTTFSSQVSPTSGLNRTSSVSSNRSNIRSVSNESANMPPPPPPPRRRQFGRTSTDRERPYVASSSSPTENKRNSFDGKRRTSVASESSLRYEYTPTSENEQALYSPKEELEEPRRLEPEVVQSNPNILDDMEKFQREIDELREKYKQTAAV